MSTSKQNLLNSAIEGIFDILPRDREQDILASRFGLNSKPKLTLDAIGRSYNVTRERIRQLEKGILLRLQVRAEEGKLPALVSLEEELVTILKMKNGVMSIKEAALLLNDGSTGKEAELALIAGISTKIGFREADDDFHAIVFIEDQFKGKTQMMQVAEAVQDAVDALESLGQPMTIKEAGLAIGNNFSEAELISKFLASKHVVTRKDLWGLKSWSSINPRSIKDKIFIVLREKKEPMHFTEIHNAIKADKELVTRNFTVQATHNELIKDPRFVLVGRGQYSLAEWGAISGTVADIIEMVIKEAGEPLHRDEIIKRVLKHRQVKETTIILNVQNKKKFVRTATATFDIKK